MLDIQWRLDGVKLLVRTVVDASERIPEKNSPITAGAVHGSTLDATDRCRPTENKQRPSKRSTAKIEDDLRLHVEGLGLTGNGEHEVC